MTEFTLFQRLQLVSQIAEEQQRLGINSDLGTHADLRDLFSGVAMDDPRFNAIGLCRGDKGMVAYGGKHGDAALCLFMNLPTKGKCGNPTAASHKILHTEEGIEAILKTVTRLSARNQ